MAVVRMRAVHDAREPLPGRHDGRFTYTQLGLVDFPDGASCMVATGCAGAFSSVVDGWPLPVSWACR